MTRLPHRFVDAVNARVVALRDHPRRGPWARRRFAIVTDTGRRSGRTFSTPVVAAADDTRSAEVSDDAPPPF